MSELAAWLRLQLSKRGLTQNEVAVYAGVGQATLSDVLNRGHVPKVETLFRLADYFHTSRVEMLRLAGHLPAGKEARSQPEVDDLDEALVQELLAEFRQVPDAWKPVAIEQMAQYRRLAELRPVRIIGEEGEEAADEDEGTAEAAADAA